MFLFFEKLCFPSEQSAIVLIDMTQSTYDTRFLRQQNLSNVLRNVREQKGISRADLARRLGLSRSSVSSIVDQLLALGVVTESHLAKSSGGRPPVVLQLQPDCCQVIGVDLGSSHITIVTMNLNGHIRRTLEKDFECAEQPQGAMKLMLEMIDIVRGDKPLLGVGIAVSSPVQNDQLSSRILPKWSNIDVASVVEDHVSAPVLMENDANLGALAEKWWGSCQGIDDFVYIKMATGVGAGLVQNGQLLKGATGYAGEIGHVPVSTEGTCRCGMTGCLESLIGLPNILADLDIEGDLSQVHQALREIEYHPNGLEYMNRVAALLSGALAMLINVLNPTRIVIWGPIPREIPYFLTTLRRHMANRNLWTPLALQSIMMSELGDQGIAQGAATLILDAAFQNPLLFQRISTT